MKARKLNSKLHHLLLILILFKFNFIEIFVEFQLKCIVLLAVVASHLHLKSVRFHFDEQKRGNSLPRFKMHFMLIDFVSALVAIPNIPGRKHIEKNRQQKNHIANETIN